MVGSTTLLLCQPATGLAGHETLERIAAVLATPTTTAHKVALFPELFLSGYTASVADPAAACENDRRALVEVERLCARHHGWVVVGAVTEDVSGFRNSSVCIDSSGRRRGLYHKCRLFGFDEADAFAPGTEPTLFDTPLGRTGMAICFDIEDPLLVSDYANHGGEFMLVPTANMRPYMLVPSVKVRARALDNNLCIAYANFTGVDGDLDFPGDSIVINADGTIAGQLGPLPGVLALEFAA